MFTKQEAMRLFEEFGDVHYPRLLAYVSRDKRFVRTRWDVLKAYKGHEILRSAEHLAKLVAQETGKPVTVVSKNGTVLSNIWPEY